MPLNYAKAEKINLKDYSEFNEAWVRDRIVEDPSILGIGDLEIRDVERIQPKAGRLDLLLRNPETDKRYEVELMLGSVDESHIVRTMEYWDIEKRRWPQYEHAAVIIAEDITTRFLNVISLFNGAIPMIAIQMNALKLGDQIILHFAKVLDEVIRGGEQEDNGGEVKNRDYWEKKGSKTTMEIVDSCLDILHEIDSTLNLKYNKYYIGLTNQFGVNNFVVFRAKKQHVLVNAYGLNKSEIQTWHEKMGETKLSLLSDDSDGNPRFRIFSKEDLDQYRNPIKELFAACYQGTK